MPRAKANIHWITDQLATGGDLSVHPTIAAQQAVDIAQHQPGLVIDTRTEANDADVWGQLEVPYLWLPTDDKPGQHHIPASLFDDAVEAARPVLDAGNKVIAHCHMGVNRGPSVALAIMLDQGWDAVEAFDRIREKRPQAACWYAEDALAAHWARNPHFDPGDSRERLRERMEGTVHRPAERVRINRIIEDHRMMDEIAWLASGGGG